MFLHELDGVLFCKSKLCILFIYDMITNQLFSAVTKRILTTIQVCL